MHLSSECDDREDDGSKVVGAGKNSGRGRKEFHKKDAQFMDGLVSGVTLVSTQPRLSQIQKMTQKMCNWTR